jgi:ABC-2 type transport system ATP-binding protein
VQPLAQVVADLLKPFVGSTPNAPVEPTAAWVLLAAVRRELGIDTGTGSTVTSNSVANTSTTTSLTAVTPTVASTAAVNPLVVPTPLITITDGIINGSIGTPFTGTLVYTVVSGPTGGAKINLNTSTGTYTYLPYLSDVTSGTPENFSVLVAQQTAFDTALESIPLVGSFVPQLLVTVYQAPVLGQLLAQIIGSSQVVPVNVDLATLAPAGTPVAYTYKVASFDGTLISTNFFPASGLQAGDVAPTIMDGPGLGNAGDTNPNSTGPVGVGTFRDAGYNVVTWDPRGEYDSGGVLQLDNPAYEGKDVSAVISWIAYQNGVQLDNPGDPRLGMIGGSYGGGIQWVSAAQDPRIDAIVPTIAWNSLNEALYPDGAFKTSWASLLLLDLVQTGARINPQLYSGVVLGDLFGVLTQSQQDLLTSSGPAQTVSNITAPTLLIQGTVDDLFTLQQAMTNANLLTLAGNPNVKMIWYCGGHGVCLDPVDSTQQNTILTNATLDWMNTYLKGETSADTLPTFQWVDQTGQFYTADTLPTSSSFYGTPITDTSTGGGFLPIVPIIGGSGPDGAQVALPYSLVVPTKATNAINVPLVLPTAGTTQVVGAPSVSLTYSGLGTSRFVYGQIIDNATGQVVGNVVTPIPVTLDGQTHQVTVNLEDIAYTYDPTTAPAGDPLTLQLVASTTPYQSFTSFGYINISDVGVTLPTVGAGADAMPVTSAAAAAA